jgi:hypothetical protein
MTLGLLFRRQFGRKTNSQIPSVKRSALITHASVFTVASEALRTTIGISNEGLRLGPVSHAVSCAGLIDTGPPLILLT